MPITKTSCTRVRATGPVATCLSCGKLTQVRVPLPPQKWLKTSFCAKVSAKILNLNFPVTVHRPQVTFSRKFIHPFEEDCNDNKKPTLSLPPPLSLSLSTLPPSCPRRRRPSTSFSQIICCLKWSTLFFFKLKTRGVPQVQRTRVRPIRWLDQSNSQSDRFVSEHTLTSASRRK